MADDVQGAKSSSPEYMLGPELGAIIVDQYVGGTDDRGCYSGQGEALFRSGNKYVGEFHRGVMDGRGRYTWVSDGTIYEGDFRKNELSGNGRYTWSDGSSYEGSVTRGLRSGNGTFTGADGTSVYEGSWKASKRHGYGVQRYGVGTSSPSSYAGDWLENRRHGRGVMTYASGNVYEGDWDKDRKEGSGTMTWTERRERYTGAWKADLQRGYGEHVWLEDRPPASVAMDTQKQMCNVYRGEWLAGLRHGQGTFMYADGSRHTGQWHENKKHGPAVFISDSGRTFEGRFENDAMLGKTNQDEEHPELSSAIKLKISDLLRAGDEAERAAVVRDVERSALQINSDLKLVYKHYAKPGATAPRDSTMFTMSMQQFVAFARDCRALTPCTSVTVGEVYRLFFRMRRQHAWELTTSLTRVMAESSGGDSCGVGAEKQESRGGSGGGGTGGGEALAIAEREAQGEIYDSRRAITFREFVEGVVRLATIVDSQAGSCGTRRYPLGNPAAATMATPRSSAAAAFTPRFATAPAVTTTPGSPSFGRIGAAPMEGAGSLCTGSIGGGGGEPEGAGEGNVNDQFKVFVAHNLSGLLVKFAAKFPSGGSGGPGNRGAGRGGGRGARGGGAAGSRRGVAGESRQGEDETEKEESGAVKELERAEEQVHSLYRLYSGPLYLPMTLRSLLRISRDADLERRAGLTSEDVKKAFAEANAFLQSRGTGDGLSADGLASPPGDGGLVGTLDSNISSATGAAAAVDLDLLDQELMPDEFKAVIVGLFELLREKASAHGSGSGETVSVDNDSAKPSPEEEEAPGLCESDGTAAALPSQAGAGATTVADDGDEAVEQTTVPPEDGGGDDADGGDYGHDGSGSGNDGRACEPRVLPEWLADPKAFVARVLEWSEEGRAKRSRRGGARPPKRRFPLCV